MRPVVHIHIGDYFASQEPVRIWTVLGSCVAACLYDPVAKIAGMNHILLVGDPKLSSCDDSARFGINAMEVLINEMVGLGAVRSRFVAKVFGGGNLLGLSEGKRPGPKNIAFVLGFLKNEGIGLVGKHTGGSFSRKLYLDTDSFEAYVKKGCSKVGDSMIAGAKKDARRVKAIPTEEGEVTLF